jgi:hypothetical protein
VSAGLIPGCILHCRDFQFHDGATANKYLVIVGAKTGSNFLVVLATSQQHHRGFVAGCHHEDGYYHVPGGSKDWFPKDTWLLLAEPYEITAAEMLKQTMQDKKITIEGHLSTNIAEKLRQCVRDCPDVSPLQIALL